MRAALGSDTAVDALLGPVKAAMPTVASFVERLADRESMQRTALLAVADRICEHQFDLLGSGLTALGSDIDWHADFKVGRRWPVRHHSIVPLVYADASDIKVPWELSRFQHLPVLAAAYGLTGREKYLDEVGSQLEHWIAANPVEMGPNWACTMEVAIRAVNWIAALVICGEAARGKRWLDVAVGSLLLHGRFIRNHLEDGDVRGNHYLSDIVGLLVIAALFSRGYEGRAWAHWAVREIVREMEHQVLEDGCDHEASTAYHRLVCELFICGTQAADALAAGSIPGWYRERLQQMLQFTADYTRPDGLAPLLGDSDDGRFLPLADYGGDDPRRHDHLFRQAGIDCPAPRKRAAYPRGGFYFLRGAGMYVAVRCGPTGVGGRGPHAHNDQLSFELAADDEPLIVDPGSGVYTSDPKIRNTFRSTRSHATLSVGGHEQNQLLEDSLFLLRDGTRAEMLSWMPDTQPAACEMRHHGYERLDWPATHTRRLEVDFDSRTVVVSDTLSGDGDHVLEWTFPLAPCTADAKVGGALAQFSHVRLSIESPGVRFWVEDGRYSPRYGAWLATPFVRARKRARRGADITTFTIVLEAL